MSKKNKNKNKSPRPGSVKANRAAGTNKAAQNKAAKAPSPSPSPAPARQQAKAAAQMSVKDRRAGAKAAGVSLRDFKQGKTGANAVARKTAQVNKRNPALGSPNPSESKFDKPMYRGGGMYGKDVYNPNSPDYKNFSRPENNSPDNSNAYKYTKADNSYSGSALRTKMAGGQYDPLMREIDSSNGYQTFQQRTHDEDGKFNTNKFFSEAIKGYENDGLSNTEMMSTEGLYQDRYHGPSSGSSWSKYAGGAQHSDAEAGVLGAVGAKGDNFYKAANKYMADGGYAGDVLKQIDQTDGEKGRLTSPDQIAWYNSVVKRAQDFDWTSTYGEGKGSHDPRGLKYGGKAHEQRSTTGHTSTKSYTPTTYDGDGNVSTQSSNSHDPSTEVSYDPSSLLPNQPGKAISISNDSWGMKKEKSLKDQDQELVQKYPGYVPGHKTAEGWVSGYLPDSSSKEMSYTNVGQERMSNSSKPYASRSKSSMMNFNFSPYKFQQGQ